MIINLKSQTDLSGLYIISEGSTLLEHKGIYGISHALEHLVCKAFDDLNDDFDRDGFYLPSDHSTLRTPLTGADRLWCDRGQYSYDSGDADRGV